MKTLLNLYIDADSKALAKSKGINISRTFQEFMNLKLEMLENKENKSPEEENAFLKQKLALTMEQLTKAKEEIEQLKKNQKEIKTTRREVIF